MQKYLYRHVRTDLFEEMKKEFFQEMDTKPIHVSVAGFFPFAYLQNIFSKTIALNVVVKVFPKVFSWIPSSKWSWLYALQSRVREAYW